MSEQITITDMSTGKSVETDSETMKRVARQDEIQNLKPEDTIASSDKQLMESPEVEDIANRVIQEQNVDLGPAQVGYFLVYPNISKKRAAKTKKCSREVNHFSGLHYLVQVSGEMWDMLDQQTRYMVVWNQLLHIEPVYKAKKGEWVMKTRKPEYTDFYQIADSRGSEWHKTVQAVTSSLYDMSPRDESQISLF